MASGMLRRIFTAAALAAGLAGCAAIQSHAPPEHKWEKTLAKIEDERALYKVCAEDLPSCPSPAIYEWQQEIKRAAGKPPLEPLEIVNDFVNATKLEKDKIAFGMADYWTTPLEFLGQSGDCEDYAIAKYITLRQLGFTPEQLRIMVVENKNSGDTHAVLAAEADGEVYILDNLFKSVDPYKRIARHYEVEYEFNEERFWRYGVF